MFTIVGHYEKKRIRKEGVFRCCLWLLGDVKKNSNTAESKSYFLARYFFRYLPVSLFLHLIISSGVPLKIRLPP